MADYSVGGYKPDDKPGLKRYTPFQPAKIEGLDHAKGGLAMSGPRKITPRTNSAATE